MSTTTHSRPRVATLRRAQAVVLALTLAVGTVTAASSSASAVSPTPVPPGLYLNTTWVEPGGWVEMYVVGSGCDSPESAAFVDAQGSTPVWQDGWGDYYWTMWDFSLKNWATGELAPIGLTGPVEGNLVVTCSVGATTATYSFPLLVSPTPPPSTYHTSEMWSWYSPDGLAGGAEVTVSAMGFEPGESATITFVNDTLFQDAWDFTGAVATPVTVTADGEGAVTGVVTIPVAWAETDVVTMLIAGSSSHYLLWAGSTDPYEGEPSIAISGTQSAFPGGAVTVDAGGFVAGETVVVALHSATDPAVVLGTMTANGAGIISGSVYLPAEITPGSYRVWAGAKAISYLLLNSPLSLGSRPTTARTSGSDRYQTAVATAQSFAPFAPGTGTVYLTSGQAFPDALGAGALAAEIGAPVLLTSPASLPDAVRAELLRLHPAHVKVVGGTAAVSAAVLAEVDALAFTHDTVRLGGADRYDTNRLLVADALDHATTVYIAVGSNFPDALAAGPAAATVDGAVILVNGSATTLDTPTLGLLTSLGVTQVRLVGGTSAISTGIETQLNGLYPGQVVRLAGADRYDTAAKIVADAWPGTAPEVILASGTNFPDALAAGALGLPMLTTRPTCVPAVVLAQIGALQPATLTLVGGTAALSANVAQLGHC